VQQVQKNCRSWNPRCSATNVQGMLQGRLEAGQHNGFSHLSFCFQNSVEKAGVLGLGEWWPYRSPLSSEQNEVVVLHTFHGSTDKSLKVRLYWNLLAVAYHPLGSSFKLLLPRIWSIEMPGSTKLARPSFTETRSGGILVLIPGSWVVICRISLMFLLAWQKRSMLFWACKGE